MNDEHDPAWTALARCAGWEHHCYATGPLARLLMHVVTDPAGLLRGPEHGSARASVRLVLRGGATFGVMASAPRRRLPAVVQLAGRVLAGQCYDESAFGTLDAALAAALLAAGLAPARVTLEHQATLLPRPPLSADYIGAMALQAVNAARRAQGLAALPACPAQWAAGLRQACAFDDPALLAYVATLDAHALAYRSSARAVYGVALDRLTVHNVVAAPQGHARNRMQALEALPWLLPLLTTGWGGAGAVCHAIDAGLPLHDAVARAFGVPREVVRWLGRDRLPGSWTLDAGRLQRLLALLAWLPPERRPRSHAQFAALTALGSALAAPFSYRRGSAGAAGLARIAGGMRHWLAHATQGPLRAAPPTVAEREAAAQWSADLADAGDFLRALFESRQTIDGLDEEAADASVLHWCAGIRPPRLLALSRRWHALVAAAPDAQAAAANARWPAVLASAWHGQNRTVIELTGADQLRIEGQRMGHCVASHETACRTGNSVIVSLRSPSGAPLSTAELHLVDDVPAIRAGQHRAARNAAPDDDCVRALGALLQHLNRADQGLVQRRRAYQRRQLAQRARSPGEALWKFSAGAQQAARRLATPPVAAPANLALCG